MAIPGRWWTRWGPLNLSVKGGCLYQGCRALFPVLLLGLPGCERNWMSRLRATVGTGLAGVGVWRSL